MYQFLQDDHGNLYGGDLVSVRWLYNQKSIDTFRSNMVAHGFLPSNNTAPTRVAMADVKAGVYGTPQGPAPW